jgi:phage terminase Nu1 subunit (DNA packaging protein)
MLVNSKQLAQVLSISQRQVQLLARRGQLSQLERDQFALGPAVQAYVRFKEAEAERRHGGPLTYTRARTALVVEQAKMLKMQRQELESQFIRQEELGPNWALIKDSITRAFVSLPAQLAPAVAAAQTPDQVEIVVRGAIHKILNRLAKGSFPDEE